MTSLLSPAPTSPATTSPVPTTASTPMRSLGLERLVRRLVAEDGFADSETALRGIASYERFFFLAADHLKEHREDPLEGHLNDPLAPSYLVDRVWQRHMLDTKAYTQDCLHWAGEYIHRDPGATQEAFERCVRLLGVDGEAEWDRPGQVHTGPLHTHTELAALEELGGQGRTLTEPGRTLGEADFSDLLARVRVALQQKPVTLPWITQARQLLEDDPVLAVEEYRRFLTLLICETGALTPCKLIDEFWHQHILDSRNYALFCAGAAGRYLFHIPRYEKTHEFHKPGFTQTQVLYKKHFGSLPPAQIWAHMGESGGCSSEPAPLYTIDLQTRMQTEIAAGNVDKRHYDQFHPVLRRKALPVHLWKEFLHAADAVPRLSWSDWIPIRDAWEIAGGTVMALVFGSFFATFGSFSATSESFSATFGFFFLVGAIVGFLITLQMRKRDPREVQRVLSEYAPRFARVGIDLKASEKFGFFVVDASEPLAGDQYPVRNQPLREAAAEHFTPLSPRPSAPLNRPSLAAVSAPPTSRIGYEALPEGTVCITISGSPQKALPALLPLVFFGVGIWQAELSDREFLSHVSADSRAFFSHGPSNLLFFSPLLVFGALLFLGSLAWSLVRKHLRITADTVTVFSSLLGREFGCETAKHRQQLLAFAVS